MLTGSRKHSFLYSDMLTSQSQIAPAFPPAHAQTLGRTESVGKALKNKSPQPDLLIIEQQLFQTLCCISQIALAKNLTVYLYSFTANAMVKHLFHIKEASRISCCPLLNLNSITPGQNTAGATALRGRRGLCGRMCPTVEGCAPTIEHRLPV